MRSHPKKNSLGFARRQEETAIVGVNS